MSNLRRQWRLFFRSLLPLLIASSVLAGNAADRLREIQKRGELLWGADAEGGAPYVFPDSEHPENLTGFEYDLAEALAKKLGVKSRMVQNQWDQLIPALDRGNFDIILNGLELTPENRRQVAMTRPYYKFSQQIVTRKETEGLTALHDLENKPVGVLSGTAGERILQEAGLKQIHSYPGNVESLRDLKAKRIDAAVMDLPIALYYVKPDAALKFSGPTFSPGYYGIGVRPQDPLLLAALDQALLELADEHALEKICRKYNIWDDAQESLKDYQPEAISQQKKISTLREWPKYLPLLLRGAVTTVEISVLAMGLAVVVGLALVLVRLYAPTPLSWLAKAYVEVVRGTPLLIQLFLIYYGLPELGIRLNAFLAGILGLGMNYAASEAENYRAGIQSIPRGQSEAAHALGMNRWQALQHIVLPQALRIVIPPVTNDFIAMFKDSSIVSVITMVELTKVYGMLANATYDYIGLGLMTAAIYFGLSYPASLFAVWLEKKLQHDHR